MKIEKQYIPVILTIIILFLLLIFKDCKNNKLKTSNNLLTELNDNLIIKINKDKSKTAIINTFKTDNVKLFLKIKSKDSVIIALQKALQENKNLVKNNGSITIINTSTKYDGTSTSSISILPVINGDSLKIYPTYTSFNKDTTWIKYKIIANKDSINLNIKMKDKFTLILGEKRIGIFKKQLITKLDSKNPFTDIDALRSIEVKDNRKNNFIGIGIQAGYGITTKGLSPYLGIGVNFKIL